MTQKIIVPGWEKLSDQQKKQAEECISSILSARQSSVTLLKLLSQNRAEPEFIARLEELSNQKGDFEIVSSATGLEAEKFKGGELSANTSPNTDDICQIVCNIIQITGISQEECHRVCRVDQNV
ncbi:MAG: hypothetical protein PUP92_34165 [Rhizonema sp. PD38]|nr:hypothetical protein [Rhizonema sp. PD38]